ncbi:MAG: hypothetical protein EPN93_19165 [Spirochaetes bacterium]|nr:MAG: hypothetical protein EPN93_19165 [Spirochaetota bacterium]
MIHRRNAAITVAGFALSAVISLSTFTDYYLNGLWEYQWGYMARAGIMMQLFYIYSLLTMVYGIIMFARRNRVEADESERVKLRLLVFSIILFFQLKLGSIPAMHGIDFYPLGNFAFIPLVLMAWGMYRHDIISMNWSSMDRHDAAVIGIFILTEFPPSDNEQEYGALQYGERVLA